MVILGLPIFVWGISCWIVICLKSGRFLVVLSIIRLLIVVRSCWIVLSLFARLCLLGIILIVRLFCKRRPCWIIFRFFLARLFVVVKWRRSGRVILGFVLIVRFAGSSGTLSYRLSAPLIILIVFWSSSTCRFLPVNILVLSVVLSKWSWSRLAGILTSILSIISRRCFILLISKVFCVVVLPTPLSSSVILDSCGILISRKRRCSRNGSSSCRLSVRTTSEIINEASLSWLLCLDYWYLFFSVKLSYDLLFWDVVVSVWRGVVVIFIVFFASVFVVEEIATGGSS